MVSMKQTNTLTIGSLAKSAKVGVETIRFYERKAIIRQPPKRNGFRYYSDEDVRIVRLVKKLQGVGFSLDEIKEFLVFKTCSKSRLLVEQKSTNKIVEIKQKITELQSTLKALEKFSSACGSESNNSIGCDLLDCFDNEWKCCE